MSNRRWPAVVVLVVVLGALLGLSSRRDPRSPAHFGLVTSTAMPVAAPAGAMTSTWYCADGTAQPGAAFNLSLILANAGTEVRTARITWFPSTGSNVTRAVSVPGNDSVTVAATTVLTAPTVSALVEVDGGDVAVEHAVSGPNGSSVAPCATQASDRWYFANGVTERDAQEVLALFNPFPDDAVVDLTFSTDLGQANPREVQGLPIPAGSTVYVKVQDVVRRRAVAAVAVTARTGRLVVDRVQVFDGSAGRSGVSLALAAPAGADTWQFPDGLFQPGSLGESWHIYNPNDDEAEVTLTVVPVSGDTPDPVDLTVPPHTEQSIDAAAAKIAPGVAHSATITSQNGVPVVAERAIDARAPSARRGWSSTLGSAITATRWLFPAGEAGARTDEWIVVSNPGAQKVTISVLALADRLRLPIESLQDLAIPAGGRLALRLGDHIERTPLPVVVEASGKVAVERDVYGVGRVGVSAVLGVPLA